MSSSDSEEFASADEGETLGLIESVKPEESKDSSASSKSYKNEEEIEKTSGGEMSECITLALSTNESNIVTKKLDDLEGEKSLSSHQVEPKIEAEVNSKAISTLSQLKIADVELSSPDISEKQNHQTINASLKFSLEYNKKSECSDGWSDNEFIEDSLEVPSNLDESKISRSSSDCGGEIYEDDGKVVSDLNSSNCGKGIKEELYLSGHSKSSKPELGLVLSEGVSDEASVHKLSIKPSNTDEVNDCEGTCSTQSNQESKSSWGWNSWGSSILSAATGSMSVLKSHVTQGIDTVLDTVESNLGVPSPEDLAKEDIKVVKELHKSEEVTPIQKSNLLSSIVSVIETTGNKVLTGGLDTLEMIGKTTMNVLQENDPGLRKKRAIFTSNSISLSEALREAKEEAIKSDVPSSEQLANFSTYFDKHEGLVHLEALEMLSKNYEFTVEQELAKLSGPELGSILKIHEIIQEVCELEENDPDEEYDHEFEKLLKKYMKVNPTFCVDPLLKAQSEARIRIQNYRAEQEKGVVVDGRELHTSAMDDMSKICAIAMHFFHKTSEYLLVNEIDIESCIEDARSLGSTLSCEISILAAKYSSCLNTAADDSENPDEITPMITNVYLEGTNCGMYIQNALKLLIPILKTKAILTS